MFVFINMDSTSGHHEFLFCKTSTTICDEGGGIFQSTAADSQSSLPLATILFLMYIVYHT